MFSCVCFITLSALKQQDYMLEQIDFGCFLIVICDNTAVLPYKYLVLHGHADPLLCRGFIVCSMGAQALILQVINALHGRGSGHTRLYSKYGGPIGRAMH